MKLSHAWYTNQFWPKLLLPLSGVFLWVSTIRKWYYILRRPKLPIPVIVVGNITVGGTGKTPLVIALVKQLQAEGKRVGVVSRGYGAKGPFPVVIGTTTTPDICGDEPFLIHLKTGAPVCCAPKRLFAAQLLIESGEVDIIVSDDGLQHYALDRQFEINVIDGKRRFGNGCLLPAGPLREPVSRLKTVNLNVCNGKAKEGEIEMKIEPLSFVNLSTGQEKPITFFKQQSVTAVCGIGNPERFFDSLNRLGCIIEKKRIFQDHHPFKADDFKMDGPIIMTEKDAVKCYPFATKAMWILSVEAKCEFDFTRNL